MKKALHKAHKSNAGRPPYDCVLLFKILVLQRLYVLTLRQNGREITVTCPEICLGGEAEGYDSAAQAFLRVCDRLTDLLTSTPEWEALPDYEFFYH